MNLNRIDVKLAITYILLILIILLPLGFVMNQIFTGFYYAKVQEETSDLSQHYAEMISKNRELQIVELLELVSEISQVPMYIVNHDGEIIANSNVPGLVEGARVPTDQIVLLSEGTPIEDKERSIEGEKFIVSGSPIFFEGTFVGAVYVLHSIVDVNESINNVRNLLFLAGIGAFFVALGFTVFISRRLSSPLFEMERAARKLAKGDLETKVEVTTKDEIGSLAIAINDLAKDLKRYRNTRSEYFANISHELKTPMTYLEGYAKVLQDKMYSTEEEKMQYLSIIQHEAKRLTRLINDLSDLSKMEEDKIPLNFEWIDLVEVIDSVILKTKIKVKEKGFLLKFDYEKDIPLIYGDGFRLEQVFLNLVDNALRYTDEGLISINIKQVNHHEVKVEFKDTGRGIPEDELPYIFERFYRVEKSRSREHGGSGLGLAIVKKLVELHQAKIQVSSQLRKGTKFEITFPLNNREEK